MCEATQLDTTKNSNLPKTAEVLYVNSFRGTLTEGSNLNYDGNKVYENYTRICLYCIAFSTACKW